MEHLFIFWIYSLLWTKYNVFRKGSIKVAKYSLKVQLMLIPPISLIFLYFYSKLDHNYILSPVDFSMYELYQWLCMFIYEDFLFHHIHRILHLKSFYRFHKLHHKWKKPVPWEALYASNVENIFINFFPVFSAPLIVGLKVHYLFLWVAISTLVSVISHGNLNTSHNLHHKLFNVNYGTLCIFDRLYGTYKKF